MKRAIQRLMLDPLSLMLLDGQIKEGSKVQLRMENGVLHPVVS
jgi:predicted transcriptional regulator